MSQTEKTRKTKKKPPVAPRVRPPAPCEIPGCAGVLVPRDDAGELVDHFDDDRNAVRCPADGSIVTFNPELVGTTCGGLQLVGWNVCAHCGGIWVTRRGKPHTGGHGGRWKLSAGGRSLDVGGMRIRPEAGAKGSAAEVVTLMARISRMPAFEAALEKIASCVAAPGDAQAVELIELARVALSIGDGAEEIDA